MQNVRALKSFPYFNRTIIELKLFLPRVRRGLGFYFNRTIIELKLFLKLIFNFRTYLF